MITKRFIFLYLFMVSQCYIYGSVDTHVVDAYLKGLKDFSGAVLIAHNDTILFKKGYGCANYEFAITNRCDTKFPIASNTKSFTAVAIMQLHE